MSSPRKRDLAAEIRVAVGDENLKGALFHAVTGVNEKRRQVVARFPGYEKARDRARVIQEEAIADLPALIDRFSAAVEANGGTIHRAATGEEACRTIAEIAAESGAKRVTKSKSMTSEEIDLNDALEAAGLHVRETDLGEYIIQVSGDRPSHITAPIIHMSVEDVREVFRDKLGFRDVPHEPAELTQLARQKLRSDFLAADLGITGANFLLADTGTAVIVENEGNVRLTTQIPPVHVVLAGVDKLLPKAADLLPFMQLLPRSATGQLLTSYLSFISGPGWQGSPFSPGKKRAFHVVLLDNGRMAMRDDPLLVEALYCIRCGGCMTVCPPYQVVGGHVYGGPTYPSGIGNAWEAGVRGLETAASFNELCTTCSRCQSVCPVHIDIPWMNTVLRERIAEAARRPRGVWERLVYDRLLPTAEEGSVSIAKRVFSNPGHVYRKSRKGVIGMALRSAPLRAMASRMAGIAAARPLPVPQKETLSTWHRKRGGRLVSTALDAKLFSNDRRGMTVFLFADCHTDHVETAAGKAAIRCLEKSGLGVVLVSGQCCGRAALSQGMLRTASSQAKALQAVLAPAAKTGHAIVGVEPSCLSAIVDDHRKLIPGDDTEAISESCQDVLELLEQRLSEIPEEPSSLRWKRPADGATETVVVHGHCQQKTLGWLPSAVSLLRSVPGLEVRVTSTECCGMAGSFGYKSDFYPVSAELGKRLNDEIDGLLTGEPAATGGEGDGPCRILACGTSCRAQIADIGGKAASHPVELIDERLDNR